MAVDIRTVHARSALLLIDGDHWATCTCGANSGGYFDLDIAKDWVCPRLVAQFTRRGGGEAEAVIAREEERLASAMARAYVQTTQQG
jgi:hypothetical protein